MRPRPKACAAFASRVIEMRRQQFDPLVGPPQFHDSNFPRSSEVYIVQFVTQPLDECMRRLGDREWREKLRGEWESGEVRAVAFDFAELLKLRQAEVEACRAYRVQRGADLLQVLLQCCICNGVKRA